MDTPFKLRGQIERITFSNEENGFTIAQLKVQGEKSSDQKKIGSSYCPNRFHLFHLEINRCSYSQDMIQREREFSSLLSRKPIRDDYRLYFHYSSNEGAEGFGDHLFLL